MKNKFVVTLMPALALAFAPLAATASELGYRYIEGGYAQLNQEAAIDGGGSLAQIDDIEAGGLYIAGSTELVASLHLFGGYKSGSDEVSVTIPGFGSVSSDIDLNQFHVGLGYHHPLSDRADLVTEVSYLSTEVDVEGDDADGEDVRIAVGVRGLLAARVEGWVKGHYTDGDAYDGAFSASLGGQLKLTPIWGLTGEVEVGDSASVITFGARASF